MDLLLLRSYSIECRKCLLNQLIPAPLYLLNGGLEAPGGCVYRLGERHHDQRVGWEGDEGRHSSVPDVASGGSWTRLMVHRMTNLLRDSVLLGHPLAYSIV